MRVRGMDDLAPDAVVVADLFDGVAGELVEEGAEDSLLRAYVPFEVGVDEIDEGKLGDGSPAVGIQRVSFGLHDTLGIGWAPR